jgi:hypothetical protein
MRAGGGEDERLDVLPGLNRAGCEIAKFDALRR